MLNNYYLNDGIKGEYYFFFVNFYIFSFYYNEHWYFYKPNINDVYILSKKLTVVNLRKVQR